MPQASTGKNITASSQINDGIISGADIADDTIENADIKSNAAIDRSKLSGVAGSGANSDITSLSGLTTPLSVPQGGTGLTTLATGKVPKGNGTGAMIASDLPIGFPSTGGADNQTAYTISSLDLDTDKRYLLKLRWETGNPASGSFLEMYVNSDNGGGNGNYGYAIDGYGYDNGGTAAVLDTAGNVSDLIRICRGYYHGELDMEISHNTDGSNEFLLVRWWGIGLSDNGQGNRKPAQFSGAGTWVGTANVTSLTFDWSSTGDADFTHILYKIAVA